MRKMVLPLILSLAAACSYTDYPAIGKDGTVWIVPDDYLVNPDQYPKYRAIRDFQPPDLFSNPRDEPHLKMPLITKDYVWEVRHRVGDNFWIFSEKYYQEKCRRQRCYGSHIFEVPIYQDGRVEPGWRKIENPRYVGLRGNRAIPKFPDASDLDWGRERLFEPLE